MVVRTQFGSTADRQRSSGTRWVLVTLHEAARARGVPIANCRWQHEDLDDDDDRYVLTFQSAGIEHWEPFEAAELEDLSMSEPVRRNIEAQLTTLLTRLEFVTKGTGRSDGERLPTTTS